MKTSRGTGNGAKADPAKQARDVVRLLKREYPEVRCALNHSNALELLIATILSAQCTDARVNIVTADLFRKYRRPEDYVNVPASELERDIHSTGFFRQKAKSIQGACQMIIERYGGRVPETIEELTELPGVARKTANVVLGVVYGKASGVVVDTHVSRLSQRLGLTSEQAAEKIEKDLMRILPQKEWIDFSHRLIAHGRKVCDARRPRCAECVLSKICPSSTVV